MPILRFGLVAFIASAHFTSDAKDGTDVCSHREVVILHNGQHVGECLLMRRRVDQAAVFDKGRRLREPGRIPERLDLPFGLIARTGAAIETIEGEAPGGRGCEATW